MSFVQVVKFFKIAITRWHFQIYAESLFYAYVVKHDIFLNNKTVLLITQNTCLN